MIVLPKLVMVVWEDAVHDTFGWGAGLEDAKQFDLPLVYSIGWLIAKDRRGVKIAQSISNDNIAQSLVVPTKMIRAITTSKA